jgi:hypothetical protein
VEGSPSLRTPLAPLLDSPESALWKLEERTKPTREMIRRDRVRWQIVYRLSPRQPGKEILLQFPDVHYRDGPADEQTVAWAPIHFNVETAIPEADRSALRDITAIEVLPPIATTDSSWLPWLALFGAFVLTIGAAAGIRAYYRRSVGRSPAQLALYELQRLVALRLPERDQSERFITLLTTLVRRYLERQFALSARRQTTPEFVHQLEQATMLTSPEREFLRAFLQRCDAIKFANETMPSHECEKWIGATRDFLQGRLQEVVTSGQVA